MGNEFDLTAVEIFEEFLGYPKPVVGFDTGGETALRALALFALWDAAGWTFNDVGEQNLAVDRSFEIRVIDGDSFGGLKTFGETPLASLKRAFVARMSKHPRLAALVEGWGKEGPTAAAARGAYLDVFRELGGPECAEAAAAADVAVFDAAYARIVRPNCGAASRQSPLETAPCDRLATTERIARRRAFCDGLALPRVGSPLAEGAEVDCVESIHDITDDNMRNIDDPKNWGRYEPRSMARERTRGGAGAARRRDATRRRRRADRPDPPRGL